MPNSKLSRSFARIAGLAAVLSFAGGCANGIRWKDYTFEPVFRQSRADGRLTFVYFRNWAMVECTDFEETVLKDPAVLELLRPDGMFYCVPLEFYWDRPLARKWGVERPPAVVILAPSGRVLAKLSGEITTEQLLSALHEAQAAASPPAPAPAKP